MRTRAGRAALFKGVKPDIDNLAKFTLDALNGVAYKDDGLVVSLKATKVFAATAGTSVVVSTVMDG